MRTARHPKLAEIKEVMSLRTVRKAGRYIPLLIMLAIFMVGCMPSGTMKNPGWTVLTAQDDVVYAALSTGKVVALDGAKDGQEIWAYPQQSGPSGGIVCSLMQSGGDDTDKPLDAVYGIPVLTKSLLLTTSYDHHLYAFDRESGQKRELFPAGEAIIGGVTLYKDIAYFGSSDHKIYALNVTEEELIWDTPFETSNWVWGAPAVDAGRVYVGSMDHYVYAINRQTGLEEWRKDIGGSIAGAIALEDQRLFVGSVDKRMHVLSSEDGSEIWKTDELGGWVWGEALVHDGYVYFGSLDGTIHARNVENGSPRWDSVSLEGAVRAGPALAGNNLIVGTDAGALYIIDMENATGQVYGLDTTSRTPQVWVYPPPKK